jgi:hypothetical protein
MKTIKCELWVGTKTGRFFKLGVFDSITECKQYVNDCITCYHEIRRIK